ncbi:hypothetical protein [Bradyrhizobium betae]|uniref:Uncharacterized protein n=1 Tax=Bradyrhizobium betae TaxID=244734 RepID=A0A5P6P856_9BRAD|nr:hypothetical protein [Bradyrhizobium betae]MCS3731507.1 TRAP-type C4-dicarboxylate transport system permease small subunit [Bradyrhizobium betae]QFI74094.1 hypothetical protein F8237_17825 [Bradyrhizobium betae]
MTKGAAALITILLAILAATCWLAYQGWTAASDVEISTHGYMAMGLGVFFSLLVGCGLMALVFYSSRRGYDDLPQAKINVPEKDIASDENEDG